MFGKKSVRSASITSRSRQNEAEISETHIGNYFHEHESEGFAVYSDLKFLYQIGKICAQSGKYLEEGILCLDDFINLSNFKDVMCSEQSINCLKAYSTDMNFSKFLYPNDTQQYDKAYKTRTKALYLVGLIFYQVNDYDEAEGFLSQVRMELKEIKENEMFYKCEQMLAEIFKSKFFNDLCIFQYRQI